MRLRQYNKAVLFGVVLPVFQDFAAYLAFCGIVLHNAQLYETSLLENKRNQASLLPRKRVQEFRFKICYIFIRVIKNPNSTDSVSKHVAFHLIVISISYVPCFIIVRHCSLT